ncbi:RDD family protein [Saccharopolyspora shandongensis]|uniref:RDD family protein n=1 Tax=Saccharopolyspora shandongensis TaxID=418495 RepID=UPI003424EF11
MRKVGSWLDGPKSAFKQAREQANETRPEWRGQKLGLPESGPGAAAPVGRRMAAFLIDIVLAALVAALFTAPDYPQNWSLVAWVVITVVPVTFFGATPGMAAMRIWVARVDGSVMVGPWRAAVRCVLTALIVPAVVWNFDGRSWHDRLTGTIVLRR